MHCYRAPTLSRWFFNIEKR